MTTSTPPLPPPPGRPEAEPPQRLNYVPIGPERQTNAPATAGLVCGMLLFVPFVAGIAAILLGRRGLLRAGEIGGRGRRAAKAAVVLGVINLALSVLLAAASVPLAVQARRRALQHECGSRLRQLGMAAFMYAQDHRGAVAPNLDALQTYLGPGGAATAVCTCPEAGTHGVPPATVGLTITYSYVYVVPPVTRIVQIRSPATVPCLYEPLANHGGRGINVLYWDGHVEWHDAASAQKLIAQIQATQSILPQPIVPTTEVPTTAPAAPGRNDLLPE